MESIYNYSFPYYDKDLDIGPFISMSTTGFSSYKNKSKTADEWLNLWEKDKKNYLNWGESFYSKKLNELLKMDTVKISDINYLINSKFFRNTDLDTILYALKKINSSASLSFELKKDTLSPGYLRYFTQLQIEPEDVDKVTSRFRYTSFDTVFNFLEEISREYTLEEKGQIIENFYYDDAFWKYILSLKQDDEKIINTLNSLIEYKKNTKKRKIDTENSDAIIFMLENLDTSLEEKIEKSLIYKNQEYNSVMQVFLNSVPLSDLHIVIENFDKLSSEEFDEYYRTSYLKEDYGILIDGVDKVDIEELQLILNTKDELDVYKYYLDKNKIDYLDGEDNLDYPKIYMILKYAINADFTSGFFRANPIALSVIRVLENTFQTRLGYDYKFNNSLSFIYTDNKERINKWMSFLEENALVQNQSNNVPSFNLFE